MYHLYLAESWRRIIVFFADKDWGDFFDRIYSLLAGDI